MTVVLLHPVIAEHPKLSAGRLNGSILREVLERRRALERDALDL
jgi:hypothetical protein